MDGGGFGDWCVWVWSPRLGVGDMAKISQFFFFLEISCFTTLSILYHVGFSILQVV